MLVLTRKLDESIVIGGEIRITIVEIRSGRVVLGIEAPQRVSVHREEVARRIGQQEREVGDAQ